MHHGWRQGTASKSRCQHLKVPNQRTQVTVVRAGQRVDGCLLEFHAFFSEHTTCDTAKRLVTGSNEIDFDQEFIFRYSTRKNTPAAQMPNQLDEEIKVERNQTLLKDLEERLTEKNQKRVGTIEEIMVEGVSKRNSERWTGRTTNYKIVIFEPQDDIKVGDMINVKIDRATQHALYGSYVEHTDKI